MLLKFMIDLGSFPEAIIPFVNVLPVCLLPGRMLSRLFRAHGHLCASHPWEVLIGTLTITISLMSMSLLATNTKLCGWNYVCQSEEVLKSSDLLLIALTRCLAVVYIYLQFRNLRKLGSKYLLGLAGAFTIFSSFIFSIVFANLIGFDLNGLNEALPFCLLLIDFSKVSALARFSLTASVQDEFHKNIGSGMAVMGPAITLDTIVVTLALGVGTLSGVRILETMCLFGCLSVIANYLAFMTFYPACLSLVLEISRDRNEGKPLKQLRKLAKVLQRKEDENRPNPVTQKVKIIMSAGLVLVHARSRFIVGEIPSSSASLSTDGSLDYLGQDHPVQPEIPFWQFYVGKILTSNLDYGAALLFAILLAIKYVLFDDKVEDQIQELLKAESSEETSQKSSVNLDRSTHNNNINNMPIRTKGCNGLQSNGTNGVHCNGISKIKTNGTESIKSNGADSLKTKNGPLSPIGRECLDPKKNDFMPASFFLGGQDDSSSSDDDKESAREVSHAETQTDQQYKELSNLQLGKFVHSPKLSDEEPRTIDECVAIMNSDAGPEALTDEEVIILVHSRHIPPYKLESMLGNHMRGVAIRRQLLTGQLTSQNALESLPFMHYDYKFVEGSCCENVIGYVPVPVGVAGPLLMNGVRYHVPMATTEGCLVASTNRGCRAIEQSGGVSCCITNDGMTRGPVVRFPKAVRASEVKGWLEKPENFEILKETFDTTSRFARLKKIHIGQAGRNLYIRFVSRTGDAMGMNMLSKGSEKALAKLQEHFPDTEIISLSGNYCTDKKPAAINWIEGRGKSVVAEAIIKSTVVKNTLKTTVPALIELNTNKNLVGSAMAGSIGGFNAHASNIVTAIYIAAGQDPAQNVTSSNCLVMMEPSGPFHDDLHITCTMPSIEVGTVGGGTVLPPQSSCLKMLGVNGSNEAEPGLNARTLAEIICASVLAGELSLMSALAAGHLVKSHLKHNRSVLNMAPTTIKEEETPPALRHAATAPGMCTDKAS